jgi:hypothetical protein
MLMWTVTVTNPTIRSIRIRRADVNIWYYQPLRSKSGRPTLVDTERFRPPNVSGYPFHQSFRDRIGPFVDPYPPKGISQGVPVGVPVEVCGTPESRNEQ